MIRVGGYSKKVSTVYRKQRALGLSDLKSLQCSLCQFILRDPVQVIVCGHRFCKTCIESHIEHSRPPYKCPCDNETFKKNEVRKDKGCQKEIQGLEIDCQTQPHPCHWRGNIDTLEAHEKNCPNAVVKCPLACGLSLSNEQMMKHTAEHCPNRPMLCQYCKQVTPTNYLQDHYQSCEEIPTQCTFCQQNIPARKLMLEHLENECSCYDMICPMSINGCTFKEKRPKMLNHMQVHSIKVTELLMEAVSRIDKLEIAVQELTTSNEERKVQISQLTAKLEKVEVELGEKNNLISDLSRNAQLQKDKKHSVLDIVEPDCVKTLHVSKESFYTNTQTCTRGFSTLSTPPEYLLQSNSTEATVSRIQQDIEKHQTQLLRISENFQNVQQSLTQHAAVIDELRLRQDVLDVKTTNGTLVWKIPDIRRRLRDAIEGRTISLYSPPFYTSPHGYRMCIRTYLNGDGSGKGTHVSVFFVLMRSEHDSLLTYPFKQSVRFTLVNQKNPAASITEAFYPDLKSPSFNRPEKDMNIASGFPKFACQSVLQDESFTVNNMIYIKCQVDLTGLSTK